MIEHNKVEKQLLEIPMKWQVSDNMEYKDLLLSTIAAGFFRAYGLRSKGSALSMDIINSISDDTYDISKRNILVWNLYVLAKEFTENENWDMALKYIERAEKNWSRDVILGDELGVYHVSWIEQIMLERAKLYMSLGRRSEFNKITEDILINRLDFLTLADKEIGEKDIRDRCTYSCYELIALESKINKDIKYAGEMIIKALECKGKKITANEIYKYYNSDKEISSQHLFEIYYMKYRKIRNCSFDNMSYGYCQSCIDFKGEGRCEKNKNTTNKYKACSKYRGV